MENKIQHFNAKTVNELCRKYNYTVDKSKHTASEDIINYIFGQIYHCIDLGYDFIRYVHSEDIPEDVIQYLENLGYDVEYDWMYEGDQEYKQQIFISWKDK